MSGETELNTYQNAVAVDVNGYQSEVPVTGVSSHLSEVPVTGVSSHLSEVPVTGVSSHLSEVPVTGVSSHLSGVPATGVSSHLSGVPVTGVSSHLNTAPGNRMWMLKPDAEIDEYRITEYIKNSGEAEVYKGVSDEKEYVIKVYKDDTILLKQELLEKLIGKEYKHLAYIIKAGKARFESRPGEFLERYFEVLPVYREIKRPLEYGDEFKKLIAQVNEGLHELHTLVSSDGTIVHKDIKPSNIMMDDEENYRIIDFGISRELMEGQERAISENTLTRMTPQYASPELYDNEISAAVDYYALGISLYQIFANELPYKELSNKNEMRLTLKDKGVIIRESLHMPEELIKLIHGLTYYDSNQAKRKKRWGYEEVKEWLKNPESMEDLDMVLLGGGSVKNKIVQDSRAESFYEKGFGFINLKTKESKVLKDSYSLADALGSLWENGKRLVGNESLTHFFENLGSEYNAYRSVSEEVVECLNDSSADEMKENKEFWDLLYFVEPNLTKFYWKEAKEDGTNGYECEELGVHLFLAPMHARDKSKVSGHAIPKATDELIESGLIPIYLKKQLKDDVRGKIAEQIIADYRAAKKNSDKSEQKEIAVWKLGYLLCGKAVYRIYNRDFETKQELYEYLIELTNSLNMEEAVAVAANFEETAEFKAWLEYQE